MKHATKSALLVMDMQTSILGMMQDSTAFVANVAKSVAHARQHNIPVIYVVVGFRQGLPEIGPHNKGFFALKENMKNADMNAWSIIHSELVPLENEIVVTKRRISAFAGSDLEVILRGQNIQHLILTGIATSGVVLSTLREAADKDYQLSVITDCCHDNDAEVHRVLTTKIFPKQAEVFNLEDWVKSV